jgi:hypothetical protein
MAVDPRWLSTAPAGRRDRRPTAVHDRLEWGLRAAFGRRVAARTSARLPTARRVPAGAGRGKGGPKAHRDATRSALPATKAAGTLRRVGGGEASIDGRDAVRGLLRRLGADAKVAGSRCDGKEEWFARLSSPQRVRKRSANHRSRPSAIDLGQQSICAGQAAKTPVSRGRSNDLGTAKKDTGSVGGPWVREPAADGVRAGTRGPGDCDVTAAPAVAVPVRRGGVLRATTGGGLNSTASTCRLPTPLCLSAPHAVGADAVPQPCLRRASSSGQSPWPGVNRGLCCGGTKAERTAY